VVPSFVARQFCVSGLYGELEQSWTRNAYNEGNTLMAHRPALLGEFEQMVLLAVLHLGDGAYAVPIRQELVTRARRTIARGALYTTLERLELKGYLRSRFGDPIAERGGRARRYFTVTARGLVALRASRDALRSMYSGLEAILGDTP
jgi:PadR family transcriptional regulator, regulatory protein PadR